MSKSCQKVVESCQKVVKKLSKVIKVVKKMSKSCLAPGKKRNSYARGGRKLSRTKTHGTSAAEPELGFGFLYCLNMLYAEQIN
jgi:hypothetical protein